jgi:SAM-dependent methyltransferase
VEFDRHAADYEEQVEKAIGFSGRAHDFFLERKATLLRELAVAELGPPHALSVLDVGCGTGAMEPFLLPEFPRLFASDIALQPLRRARRFAPGARYLLASERLPLRAGAFDLALMVCVLHHVPISVRQALVEEVAAVVRPGGLVAVFEHNPWNPLTRCTVSRCDFDRDARLLSAGSARALLRGAGLESVRSQHLLLVPWRGRAASWLEGALAGLPLGAQYLAVGRRARPVGG